MAHTHKARIRRALSFVWCRHTARDRASRAESFNGGRSGLAVFLLCLFIVVYIFLVVKLYARGYDRLRGKGNAERNGELLIEVCVIFFLLNVRIRA